MKETLIKLGKKLKAEYAGKCRAQEVRNIKSQIKNIKTTKNKDK